MLPLLHLHSQFPIPHRAQLDSATPVTSHRPEQGSSQDWDWVFGGAEKQKSDVAEMSLAIVWEKSSGLQVLAQPAKAAKIPRAQ